MTGLPVLAFGADRRWHAHLQRVLSARGDWAWGGAFSGESLRSAPNLERAIWLLDGDDPHILRLLETSGVRSSRLFFHRHPDVATLRQCARLGGRGCLEKMASPEVLFRGLRAVETGLFAVDAVLLSRALAAERRAPAPVDKLPQLTDRQREIVRWAALGMSNKQIARRLGISPETVKSHLHHVFEREGISGRVALLAMHRPDEATDVETVET